MIGYLEGTVLKKRKDHLIVKCGSIGLCVYVAGVQEYAEGQPVSFYCYQQFKEDGQFLYGFENESTYKLFTLLIQVKGLGCRSVMNMLAGKGSDSIIRAIEQGDAAALKKLPGVGAKTAGQILLDLKGKIALEPVQSASSADALSGSAAEVSDALLSLGYRQQEIDSLNLKELAAHEGKTDVLLRTCLRELARRRKGL